MESLVGPRSPLAVWTLLGSQRCKLSQVIPISASNFGTMHIPEVVHRENIGLHWFSPDIIDRSDPDLTKLTFSRLLAASCIMLSHTKQQRSQDRDRFVKLARSSDSPPLGASIPSFWQRSQSFELRCSFSFLSGLSSTTFRAMFSSSTSYFHLLSSCEIGDTQTWTTSGKKP